MSTDAPATHSDSKTPPATYTAKQQEVIEGLLKIQQTEGIGGTALSDEIFAEKWIKDYTGSAWNRIKRGVWRVKQIAPTIAKLESRLKHIRATLRQRERATQGGTFHRLPIFEAMFTAVEDCLARPDERRLVVYVAPTGAGKSRFLRELSVAQDLKLVRANETWRNSYYFALCDVIAGLRDTGEDGEPPRSAASARTEMLKLTRDKVKVLGIDEGNYFGTHSINLVKDILNETRWAVMLCLTPAAWLKMQKYAHEFSQLRRRIHTAFEHDPLAAKDAALFLADAGLNGNTARASVLLADAANNFGGYDFANRVVETIEASEAGHPSLQDVEKAILTVQKQLKLEVAQ